MSIKSIYIIGSLRNPEIPKVGAALRAMGYDVFDDWYSAGPEADDHLRDYYRSRGMNYTQALESYAARHVFTFDKAHLERCDAAVLVYPAGKSAHLELGYVKGMGKRALVLMDGEPERYDIMLAFADKVCFSVEQLAHWIQPCKDHGSAGNSGGYASCKHEGRFIGKHVKALMQRTGEQPNGRQACHRCDNPRCVEPTHLFWGSQTDNLNDRKTKHAYRKLTQQQADLSSTIKYLGG